MGVAGGRNYLLKKEEVNKAEYIIIADNDIIIPVGSICKLYNFYLQNTNIGVAGLVALNINFFLMENNFRYRRLYQSIIDKSYRITLDDVSSMIYGKVSPKMVCHMGANKDWYNAYISSLDLVSLVCQHFGFRHAFVKGYRSSELCVNRINKEDGGKILVSNVPAMMQLFSHEVLRRVGLMDDDFNPYGYEDVDFCRRVMALGLSNYVSLDNFVFHNTDGRHFRRNPLLSYINSLEKYVVLIRKYYEGDLEWLLIKKIVCEFLVAKIRGYKHPEDFLKYGILVAQKKYYFADNERKPSGIAYEEFELEFLKKYESFSSYEYIDEEHIDREIMKLVFFVKDSVNSIVGIKEYKCPILEKIRKNLLSGIYEFVMYNKYMRYFQLILQK